VAQQRIDLVEDEEGAKVRRLLERRRDRLLRLAQPHRAQVGEPPLHDVEVEALGEVPGVGRLSRPGRAGEAEGEGAAPRPRDLVGEPREIDVGGAQRGVEGYRRLRAGSPAPAQGSQAGVEYL